MCICKETLADIYRSRRQMRRQYLQNTLEQKLLLWKWFSRWFGFKRPTIKSVLYVYLGLNGTMFPVRMQVQFTYGKVEQLCKKVLAAAQATKTNSIYLTVETASSIGM
jgi:hypothetical protein